MIRTSLAIAIALAFSTTAFAVPMSHTRMKTRAVSLSQVHVKPFTQAEQRIFERASVFTGVGGDGGGGGGGDAGSN